MSIERPNDMKQIRCPQLHLARCAIRSEIQLVTRIFLVAFWENQIDKHPIIARIVILFADGVHERRNANDRSA